MTKMTYREQLLHPNWQRRRLEILQRDEFRCTRCCDSESTLHVHHRLYVKGRMAWEYPDEELATLCEVCHEELHAIDADTKQLFAGLRVDGPGCSADALAVAAGWADETIGGEKFKAHMDRAPWFFVTGQIAAALDGCDLEELFWLYSALKARDVYTKRATVREFTAAILAREQAPLPPLNSGWDDL